MSETTDPTSPAPAPDAAPVQAAADPVQAPAPEVPAAVPLPEAASATTTGDTATARRFEDQAAEDAYVKSLEEQNAALKAQTNASFSAAVDQAAEELPSPAEMLHAAFCDGIVGHCGWNDLSPEDQAKWSKAADKFMEDLFGKPRPDPMAPAMALIPDIIAYAKAGLSRPVIQPWDYYAANALNALSIGVQEPDHRHCHAAACAADAMMLQRKNRGIV